MEKRIVKIVAHPDIIKFFRTFDTPTEKLLREEGFDLGDLTLRHFLKHYFSSISRSYNTSVIISTQYSMQSAGGIVPFPSDSAEVWSNLIFVASRYMGIGEKPLDVEPPYVALTTPKEQNVVMKAFDLLNCEVEYIQKIKSLSTG